VSRDTGSLDERAIDAAVRLAARRARVLAVVEALAWGAAAGIAVVSWFAAAVVAFTVVALRWRSLRRGTVVRAIDRMDAAARNVFVTADELRFGTLSTSGALRIRVFADAAAVARRSDRRLVAPLAPAARAVTAAIVVALVVWTMPLTRERVGRMASVVRPSGGARATALPLKFRATIEPPAYTGLSAVVVENPDRVQAIDGSALVLAIDSPSADAVVEQDGATATLVRGNERSLVYRTVLEKTGFLVIAAGGSRRTISIVVSPDALPSVRLTAPGRDLVYAGGTARISFAARATDDFGLRSLRLQYTKVSGSGENFAFEDGEIPLDIARETPRDWSGRAVRSIGELKLKEGDMLVYRAAAADARAASGTGTSDAFFIEISRLGVAAGDAFTLPDEETRYALSQQMLIVKTGQLQERRAALSDADFSEAALNLAVEQRMIRAEFVFMLGGEVENEEVEAEQSNELQEGRLQNRGQRDLRAATLAMSQAEKLLTGANTQDALTAERAAVAALQRAFARDRYILRALATRSRLDLARRLTGDTSGAADWRRTVPEAPSNRRAALLQDLLRGLGALGTTPGPDAPDPASERLLAEEAIRIDPVSSALQEVAAALQQAADANDQALRARALAAATTAAAREARRAHADAALNAETPSPSLAGAFADAYARLKPSRADRGQR
jgi:uncharacterized protein DUF4175